MEWSQLAQVGLSFVFVVILMVGIGALLKKFGLEKKWNMVKSASGLLEVKDSMFLDHKRRIMVIGMEEKRYVVLLDGERAQLIDTLEAS